MNKVRDTGLKIFFGFLLAILIFHYNDTAVRVSAATAVSYVFDMEGKTYQPDSEAEITRLNSSLFLKTKTGDPVSNSVKVKWESTEPAVATLEVASGTIDNQDIGNTIRIKRNGPGFSTIKATINDGSFVTIVSFVIKVNLEFDFTTMLKNKDVVTDAMSTKTGVMLFNSTKEANKKLYVKYVDDTDSSGGTVTGSAISMASVKLSSSNTDILDVDADGIVTPKSAGTAVITVESTTASKDKILKDTLTVIIVPTYTLEFTDNTGNNVSKTSVKKNNDSAGIVLDVPSYFTLKSDAKLATNLKWVVKDLSKKTNNTIKEGTSSKMEYSISDTTGNVDFKNVKAGTYEIYAFASGNYNESSIIPYAYMKIIVPIDLKDKNLVMNVHDTYDLLKNSNLPAVGAFKIEYAGNNRNIAYMNPSNYVIEAQKKGTIDITLTYEPSNELFADSSNAISGSNDGKIVLHVTVIDGIALSMTSATIYEKRTLKLETITTDNSSVTWSTSDKNYATVDENGLVTGVKEGQAEITATQTVNGVVKKATCKITIKKSVTKITLDPANAALAIGEFRTIEAIVSPSSDVSLEWRSSNEGVVKITKAGDLYATVQGVAGGSAVIAAINQDNVVVGYTHVTVRQPVESIVLSVDKATVSLSVKNYQLNASVYPANASDKSVKWSSANTSIATVDANGLVTFKSYGNVSIIATSVDNPSVTAICNLNIQVPVATVALDEKTKTMYVGQTARLTYTVLPTTASVNTVTWTSTNTAVASVDATGLVTAKGVGTTVIILKAVDGGQTVYCTINVRQAATGVKFDVATLNLKVGESYSIKTTFTPNDSTDTGLVWESSDTKIATVDTSGKVTGKSAGSAIIMARTELGGVAYCKLTVTQPATGLILNFSEKTIYIGSKFTLEASVSPSSATNLNVTWKSSNDKIATVSKTGEVAGLQGGVVIITCTTVEGGYVATCVVTVRESVTTVKLDYETYYLGVGKNFKLTATVATETATNQNVVWTSSNEDVATVNQKGKVTGIKTGYTTITATALDGSDVEASCEVRVVNAVESITISDNYVSLYVGDTEKLKVTIRPSNATFKSATWSTSDATVAIVDDRGVITALKAGTATITAAAQDNSGKKVICAVAVYDRVPATSITLQDKSLTMVAGEEKVVQIVLNPTTSTDKVTWSTDNPAVASVNKTTGRITARATGKAYITVMTDSGKTASIEVTVIGLNMTSLTLEQYTTYPYPLTVEGATTAVKWSIDKPQVAVVTNGYVSSRSVGTATITAIVNGRKLTCKLKVTAIS